MRTRVGLGLFIGVGLLVALALAFFVSPQASSKPDGLNKVAIDKGFADQEQAHRLEGAPTAGYEVEGVDDDRLSTGLAGVIGVDGHLRHRRRRCSSWSSAPVGGTTGTRGDLTWAPDPGHAGTDGLLSPATRPSTALPRPPQDRRGLRLRARRGGHAPRGVLGLRRVRHASCSRSPGWPASRSAPLVRRLRIEVPFLGFAVFLPIVGSSPRVDVLGLGLSEPGLWAAWNIVAKGTLGVVRVDRAGRHHAGGRPAPRPRAAAPAEGAHRHRRVHGPLPRRDRGRGRAHGRRPPVPRATTRAGCGRPGRSPRRPARCSCAPSSGASGCTWPWCPGATRARCPTSTSTVDRARATAPPPRSSPLRRRDASPGRGRTSSRERGARASRASASPTRMAGRRCTASTSRSRAGERVAVLGPNGAGKTTLVLHLNGILEPQAGTVDGRRPAGDEGQPGRDPPAGGARLPGPRRPAVHADGARRRRLRSGQRRAAGRRARRAGRRARSTASTWPSTSTGRRTTSASASAGGSRWRPCSPWSPSCSCSTSRRRTSTRPPGASSPTILEGLDLTTLVVTHDLPYALELCDRSVILDDGPHRGRRPDPRDPRPTTSCWPATGSSCPGASRCTPTRTATARSSTPTPTATKPAPRPSTSTDPAVPSDHRCGPWRA